MADAASAQQPSQEELQAYLQQMQAAEPAEIVAQAFQILAMGAEVKLGRPDARVLIDSLDALTRAGQGKLPQDLSTGMQNAVRQLQTAQVQQERAQSSQGEEAATAPGTAAPGEGAGRTPASGGQAAGAPAQEATGPGQQPGGQAGQGGGGQSMTDRLWIPGR